MQVNISDLNPSHTGKLILDLLTMEGYKAELTWFTTFDIFFSTLIYLILCGRVPASFVTHQLLGSYAVQSDIGDYDVDEHGAGIEYIKDMQFVPNQTEDLLEKIARLHVMNRSVVVVVVVVVVAHCCSSIRVDCFRHRLGLISKLTQGITRFNSWHVVLSQNLAYNNVYKVNFRV